MTFLATCPICKRKVNAATKLAGRKLRDALDRGADIEVVEFLSGNPDHSWSLNDSDKQHLSYRLHVCEYDSCDRETDQSFGFGIREYYFCPDHRDQLFEQVIRMAPKHERI